MYVEFYDQAQVSENGYDLCGVSAEILFLFFNFSASTSVETLLCDKEALALRMDSVIPNHSLISHVTARL